jgi:hypothetical protein
VLESGRRPEYSVAGVGTRTFALPGERTFDTLIIAIVPNEWFPTRNLRWKYLTMYVTWYDKGSDGCVFPDRRNYEIAQSLYDNPTTRPYVAQKPAFYYRFKCDAGYNVCVSAFDQDETWDRDQYFRLTDYQNTLLAFRRQFPEFRHNLFEANSFLRNKTTGVLMLYNWHLTHVSVNPFPYTGPAPLVQANFTRQSKFHDLFTAMQELRKVQYMVEKFLPKDIGRSYQQLFDNRELTGKPMEGEQPTRMSNELIVKLTNMMVQDAYYGLSPADRSSITVRVLMWRKAASHYIAEHGSLESAIETTKAKRDRDDSVYDPLEPAYTVSDPKRFPFSVKEHGVFGDIRRIRGGEDSSDDAAWQRLLDEFDAIFTHCN